MTIARNERMGDYGHPSDNFGAIAGLWSTYLNHKHGADFTLDPDDVGFMMVLLKIARDCHKPKVDNIMDIIGYADCVQMIREERERNDNGSFNLSP